MTFSPNYISKIRVITGVSEQGSSGKILKRPNSAGRPNLSRLRGLWRKLWQNFAASGNATASASKLGGAKGAPGGAVVSPANIAAATQAGAAAAAAAAAAGKNKKAKRKAAPRSLGPIPDRDPCMPLHIAITESIKSLRTMDHKVKLAKQVLLAADVQHAGPC